MGGVWERQISTARSVLNAILLQSGTQLNDESLHTFICKAEAIVNSRPLTIDNMSSPTEDTPLTPDRILTMKSRVVLSPPGNFQPADLYLIKRWRRVQYLVNQFWQRWRKEFFLRYKKDKSGTPREEPARRGHFPHQRRYDTKLMEKGSRPRGLVDEDGLVRKVKLVVSDPLLNERG